MFSGHFFLVVIIIAVAVILIQWLFTGFLFHKYQALTPSVWRKENTASYLASTLIALFFAFMFTFIFSLWKDKTVSLDLINGLEFGFICWLTFSIPIEIGNAFYIGYSRMFVVGKCMSSFFEYLISGAIAASMI
jgi:hypothetical protein